MALALIGNFLKGGILLFKKSKSFTFIEILVVVFIIGLLASLVVVNVNRYRAKARDRKRISDIQTLASALEAYYADNQKYPVDVLSWCEIGECFYPNSKRHYVDMVRALRIGGYINYCPQDSMIGQDGCTGIPGEYIGNDPKKWGYRYTCWDTDLLDGRTEPCVSYMFGTVLETSSGATGYVSPGCTPTPIYPPIPEGYEYRIKDGKPVESPCP